MAVRQHRDAEAAACMSTSKAAIWTSEAAMQPAAFVGFVEVLCGKPGAC